MVELDGPLTVVTGLRLGRRAARGRGRAGARRPARGRAAVSRRPTSPGRPTRAPGSPSWSARPTSAITLETKAPATKQRAGAALARRDAWLAKQVDSAVVVWDQEDDVVGRVGPLAGGPPRPRPGAARAPLIATCRGGPGAPGRPALMTRMRSSAARPSPRPTDRRAGRGGGRGPGGGGRRRSRPRWRRRLHLAAPCTGSWSSSGCCSDGARPRARSSVGRREAEVGAPVVAEVLGEDVALLLAAPALAARVRGVQASSTSVLRPPGVVVVVEAHRSPPGSPSARLGLRWASLRLRDHSRAMPAMIARARYGPRHAGRGRHRGHLHRRGGADGTVAKVLSTPDDPGRAVRDGVAALGGGARRRCWPTARRSPPTPCSRGQAAPVALVTTEGLRDVIEIARQDRPSLYDTAVVRPDAARAPRLAPRGRAAGSAADGRELDPVDLDAVPADARRRRRASRCASCTPTSSPPHEQAVAARAARRRATTSPARTRCRPSCASTSARSRPS